MAQFVENSLNGLICENENDPGLTSGNEINIPKTDGVERADAIFDENNLPAHTPQNTYASVVKSIEKKVTFTPSSHSFKIIQ